MPATESDELDRQALEIAAKPDQQRWRVRQTIEIEVIAATAGDAHTMWRHELRRRVIADPLDGWGVREAEARVVENPVTK
jgi:hypothetical protein